MNTYDSQDAPDPNSLSSFLRETHRRAETEAHRIIPPNKRKRNAVSHAQKYELRQYARDHPELRQTQLSDWFAQRFNTPCSQSRTATWLGPQYAWLDEPGALDNIRPDQKKRRKEAFPELESALWAWQKATERAQGTKLSGEMIGQKAVQLWGELPCYQGQPLPNLGKSWVFRYRERHGLVQSRGDKKANGNGHDTIINGGDEDESNAAADESTAEDEEAASVQGDWERSPELLYESIYELPRGFGSEPFPANRVRRPKARSNAAQAPAPERASRGPPFPSSVPPAVYIVCQIREFGPYTRRENTITDEINGAYKDLEQANTSARYLFAHIVAQTFAPYDWIRQNQPELLKETTDSDGCVKLRIEDLEGSGSEVCVKPVTLW